MACLTANAASSATATRAVHHSAGEAIESTASMTPPVTKAAPGQSAPARRPPRSDSAPWSAGSTRAAASQAANPTGRFTKKIQCQLAYSTSRPPMISPADAPTAPVKANPPIARPCSAGSSNSRTIMPRVTAVTIAAPAPWTKRAAMSIPGPAASPHASDAATKTAIPVRNIRFRPNKSPSLPLSSSSPPNATW